MEYETVKPPQSAHQTPDEGVFQSVPYTNHDALKNSVIELPERQTKTDSVQAEVDPQRLIRINSFLDKADDYTKVVDIYYTGKRKGEARKAQLNIQGREAVSGTHGYTEQLKNASLEDIIFDFQILSGRRGYTDESEIEVAYNVQEKAMVRAMREAAYMQLQYRVQDILKARGDNTWETWQSNINSLVYGANGQKAEHISMRDIYYETALSMAQSGTDITNVKPFEKTQPEQKTKFQKASAYLMQKANVFIRLAGLLSPATAIIPPAPPIQAEVRQYQPPAQDEMFTINRANTLSPTAVPTFEPTSIPHPTSESRITKRTAVPTVIPTTATFSETTTITPTSTVEQQQNNEVTADVEPFTIGSGENKLILKEEDGELHAPIVHIVIPDKNVSFYIKPRLRRPDESANPLDQSYDSIAQLADNGDMLMDLHDQYFPLEVDENDKSYPPQPKNKALFEKLKKEHDPEDIFYWKDGKMWLIKNNGEGLRQQWDGKTSREPIRSEEEIENLLKQANGDEFYAEQIVNGKKVVKKGRIKNFHLGEDDTTRYYDDKSQLTQLIRRKYGNDAVPDSSWSNLYLTYCSLRPTDAPKATLPHSRKDWSAYLYATLLVFDEDK